MKTKILNAVCKTRYLALLVVLIFTCGNVWGATGSYSLSGSQFGTSNVSNYSASEATLTGSNSSSWKVKGYGVIANTSLSIGKGGANYLKTPVCPDNITSIVVTWTGNASYYLALQTTSGTELEAKKNTSSAQTYTFKVSGSYTQLQLVGRRSSGTSNAEAKITSVTVNYGSSCTSLTMSAVTATPGNGRIDLSWPVVNNASSYTVTCKRKSDSSTTGISIGSVSGSGPKTCAITGLTNGTEYTWSVMPVGTGSYCADNTPATGDATPNVYYTVTWMNNGSEYTTTSVAGGQKPTFPSTPTSCDTGEGASTTFYGWATNTWSGKAATLEDSKLSGITIYTSASSMPTVTGNEVVYHAVFCKGGALTYATSIAANDVVYLATSTESGASGVTGANANGKDAAVSATQADWMPFTVQTNNTGWKLQNGTNYIQATAKNFAFTTSTPNVLTFVQEGSTGKYRMIYNDGSDDYALGNNSGSYWRFYKTNNSYPWYYVLKASAGTNYMTTCGAIDPTVTFSNGTYTIGGSALDLRTLWESNSSGAVTFSVTSAGGTGASISTASFTATTAGSCTVKASQAATASYNAIEKSATITVQNPTCATPTFSPVAGTYTEAQTVSISCATASSTIYYTTNGSDPTTSSSVYTSPLTVSSTQTIKAIAAAPGYSNSAIGSATYTIRAGTTFTLLTDASSLKAGDKLIILSTDGNYALAASDGSSTSNRGQTAKTYNYDIDESNVYVYNDDRDYKDVDILTLGGTSSGWTLATSESSGYYLYHTGSDNTLQIGNSVGTGYYWTISLNGSNEATINNTGYASYNIKKNSNSAIFSAYKTAQTAIKIYRYENTSPTVEVGTPSGTSFSYVYGNGPSNTETFTISGSNLTGNVVINAPSNYKIKKGSDSWSSSITLTPSSGTIASTTISIQLVAGLDAGSYNGNITFTNSDDLTISPIALTGTVSKANLNPSFGSDTYTITRDVSTSTSFTLTGVPSDYTGTITYSRTNSPTVSARLVIDGTNKTFTAANYSGRWTVTASFAADGNYNAKTSGVTCVVNAVTRDTYIDNVNNQSVTEEQRTDNGVDPYVSPALSDVVPGSACQGTKVHLIGWASQAFVTKVGNGTLTGADSDYTEANGFYAVGTTLPAASGTTYYAVYGEEE